VHIENVDVGVQELWAQMVRYQGEARVRGAFQLRPALNLWVGPAELRFDAGTVSAGSAEVLRDFRGSLTCTVDPFDVRTVVGMQPFQFISARALLSAELAGLEVSSLFTRALKLADGSGPLDMDIALDHGVFGADSAMMLRTAHVGWKGHRGGLDASGDIAVLAGGANADRDVFAVSPDETGRAHILIDVPRAAVSIDDSKISPLQVRHAGAFLSSTSADVTESWKRAAAVLRLQEAKLDDLRWLREAPIAHLSMLEGGRAQAGGHFALTGETVVDLSAWARVDDARVHLASSEWQGNGMATLEANDGAKAQSSAAGARRSERPSASVENLSGLIQLRDVGVAMGEHKVDGWWADVALQGTRVSAAHGIDATGRVEAKLRDGLPALYMLASSDDIPKFVPSLLPLSGLQVALEVDRHCRFTDVRILQASGGPVAAAGRLQFDPENNHGAVLIYTSPVALASMGLELEEHSSHVSPMVGTAWLTERLGPLARLASEKRLAHCASAPRAHR